jgi:hypothetical protein
MHVGSFLDTQIMQEWMPVEPINVRQLSVLHDVSLRMHLVSDAIADGSTRSQDIKLMKYLLAGRRHFSTMLLSSLACDATNLGRKGRVAFMLNSPDGVAMACPPIDLWSHKAQHPSTLKKLAGPNPGSHPREEFKP